jgi:sugar phosphate isomerase/epimerase
MVIGSGGARRSTEAIPPEVAEKCFVEMVAQIQQFSARVQLAPESLNHRETDVGNDLHRLAKALHAVNVGYCADSYHILDERTHPDHTIEYRHSLPHRPAHVHCASGPRDVPSESDPEMIAFFDRLHELDYQDRVSLEVNWNDFDSQIGSALKSIQALSRRR